MPKIAIVVSGNSFKVHIWFYTYFFDKLNYDYDIISWNRLNIVEPDVIQFNLKEGEGKGYFGRFISYLRYRKFVINQLEKMRYDKVFVFSIALGVLLYSYLRKNFYKRYIFDIHDHSINVYLKRRTFYKLIKNSFFTVISSHGFLKWLPPKGHFYHIHNYPFTISKDVGLLCNVTNFDPQLKPVNILTIGSLRDYKANKFLIDQLGNKPDFYLKFVGSGSAEKQLITYVKKNHITNVEFHGLYLKSEELDLIRDASFLNILTGSDINSKSLTTNRFYLSAVLGIPMIVNDDTFQGDLSHKYSLGCIVKPNLPLAGQLQNYFQSFDSKKYDKGRKEFIETVALDIQNLEKAIREFLRL